jgi:hypothetical protein
VARYRNGNGNDATINLVFYLVGAAIVVVAAWTLWRAWDDVTAATYRIRKDQWTCSQSRTRTAALMDGQYGRIHNITQVTCDQYTRIRRAR